MAIVVSLEGCEGCGKSTQWNLLKEAFPEALFFREPGGTELGEYLRKPLVEEKFSLDAFTEFCILQASRRNLCNQIKNTQKLVIIDRFIDSTFAYQYYAGNLKNTFTFDEMWSFLEKTTLGLIPTRTFFFDLPFEEGLSRSLKRLSEEQSSESRFEKKGKDFQKNAYQGYQELAQKFPKRIQVINAKLSIEEIKKTLIHEISKLI